MDESDSEEEILVYAEFDENVKIDKYRSIHALGLDNKNPVIQMDDSFFTVAVEVGARGIPAKSLYNLLKDLGLLRTAISSILERVSKAALAGSYQIWLGRERNPSSEGKYSSPVGTFLFFEEDLKPKSDTLFNKAPANCLKYLCKTRKYVNMEHAYVTPKEGKGLEMRNQAQEPEDDIEIPKFKSIQEAMEKFNNSWSPSDDPEIDVSTIRENDDVDQTEDVNYTVDDSMELE